MSDIIKKATIVNFQSHKNTELEFVEGINVIQGLSDSGKSAFLRSLDTVLNRGPFYLNFFEPEGSSEIEFSDGDNIARKFARSAIIKCPNCKSKVEEDSQVCVYCGEFLSANSSSDVYIINGEKKAKFGVKLPENITSVIRMNPVLFGEDEVLINFATQHEGMFFVSKDYSGSLRNKMISSLIPDSGRIDDLIKTLNSEKHGASSALKVYVKQRDVAETKINILQPHVDLILNKLEHVEITQKKLADMEAELIKIQGIWCEMESISNMIASKQLISEMISVVDNAITNLTKQTATEIAMASLKQIENQLQSLLIYDKIKLPKIENQSTLITTIENETNKFLKIKKLFVEYSEIKTAAVPKLPDVNFPDDSKMKQLENIKSEISMIQTGIDSSKTIVDDIKKELNTLETKMNAGEILCPITNKKYCDECIEALKS